MQDNNSKILSKYWRNLIDYKLLKILSRLRSQLLISVKVFGRLEVVTEIDNVLNYHIKTIFIKTKNMKTHDYWDHFSNGRHVVLTPFSHVIALPNSKSQNIFYRPQNYSLIRPQNLSYMIKFSGDQSHLNKKILVATPSL